VPFLSYNTWMGLRGNNVIYLLLCKLERNPTAVQAQLICKLEVTVINKIVSEYTFKCGTCDFKFKIHQPKAMIISLICLVAFVNPENYGLAVCIRNENL